MAAATRQLERRRPRPGSLERPVNGRLYRGTWLAVAFPLLVAAFSVGHATPLPAPTLPPAFDRVGATSLARELAADYPDRFPGSPGAAGAADWLTRQLGLYGYRTRAQRFTAPIPGRGRVRLTNLVAEAPGRSPDTILL